MQGDDRSLSSLPNLAIEDLAERVGVPVRTIRFYISEGLLPGPEGRGKAAFYGSEHLLKLSLIRRLSDQRVPLKEIREKLAALSPEDIRLLLAEDSARQSVLQQAQEKESPRGYISALLDRARAARQPRMREEQARWPALAKSGPDAPAPFPGAPSEALESAETQVYACARSANLEASVSPTGEPQPWQRFELAAGVELHVRQDAVRAQHSLIEQVLDLARSWARRRDK